MICSTCHRMLRGREGQQRPGTLMDLYFIHHRTKSSLVASADAGCYFCRTLWTEIIQLSTADTRSKDSKYFITAFVCPIVSHITPTDTLYDGTSSHITFGNDVSSLYRLDFKLHDTRRVGTFLLHPASKFRYSTKSRRRDTDYPCPGDEVHQRPRRLYRPTSSHTADNAVIQLARNWISRCNGQQHTRCRSWSQYNADNRFLPTRLIQLPATKTGDVDDTKFFEADIKLVESKDIPECNRSSTLYVTLSHRWGDACPLRLLKDNKSDFARGISVDLLPKTFEDAISLARRLEHNRIGYIWIDSLCIIQDDPEDWLRESVKMFQVYANSYCNISATAATDGTKGLFSRREPKDLWESEVYLDLEGLHPQRNLQGPWKLARARAPLVDRCEAYDMAFWDRLVERSPVNRRAWVMQERLLAPRVLHFCKDQIAWECPEHDATESFPNGVPRLQLESRNLTPAVQLKRLLSYQHDLDADDGGESTTDPELTSKTVHDHWKLVVVRYSTNELSFPSDKLIALAGIAQMMASRIGGQYVAGMWEKYLASQLPWRVKTAYEGGRLLYPSRRPSSYRAPTFSWASVDTPQGVLFPETKREDELYVSVREIHVTTQTESPFGPLKKMEQSEETSDACYIDVDCAMTAVKIEQFGEEGKEQYTAWFYGETDGLEDTDAGAEWDENGLGETSGFSNAVAHTPSPSSAESPARQLKEKMMVGVHLDCPENDGNKVGSQDAECYCVPVSTDAAGELLCLLVQRPKLDHDHSQDQIYRRVGLLVFPEFLRLDQEEILEQATEIRRRIRLI